MLFSENATTLLNGKIIFILRAGRQKQNHRRTLTHHRENERIIKESGIETWRMTYGGGRKGCV